MTKQWNKNLALSAIKKCGFLNNEYAANTGSTFDWSLQSWTRSSACQWLIQLYCKPTGNNSRFLAHSTITDRERLFGYKCYAFYTILHIHHSQHILISCQAYTCPAFLDSFGVMRKNKPKRESHAVKLRSLHVMRQSQLLLHYFCKFCIFENVQYFKL